MIAIAVRYVCGWAAAADPAGDPEWPPHPARLFMALAAAHFETRDEPLTADQQGEQRALEWVEAQCSPEIVASEAHVRSQVTSYVPVNDTEISARTNPVTASRSTVGDALRVLPDRRSRQPRTFPRITPDDEVVWFVWPDVDAIGSDVRRSLQTLCGKVTRIGHSSSMVQVWLEDDAAEIPAANFVPREERVTHRFRVPVTGLLAELKSLHEADLRPTISTWARYGTPADHDNVADGVFASELLVFRLAPSPGDTYERLGLASTRAVVDYFRRAAIASARNPVPGYISGHAPNGEPAERLHLAFMPLAFVDHRHADGHILGLGVAIPRELSTEERLRCHEAIAPLLSRPEDNQPGRLVMGRLGRWRVEPVGGDAPPKTLLPETWTSPGRSWASATPVVLDRYTHDEDEKRAIIARACERVGLPRPIEVKLNHVSALTGVPPAPKFGALRRGRKGAVRPYTHAILRFDRPVRGPVLVGAGRYLGYGVFRQLRGHNA